MAWSDARCEYGTARSHGARLSTQSRWVSFLRFQVGVFLAWMFLVWMSGEWVSFFEFFFDPSLDCG